MTDHYEARCPSCGGFDEQGCYADCPKDELTRLRSDLEKAIEALRPFAAVAKRFKPDWDDDAPVPDKLLNEGTCIEMFRNALELLSQLENSK